MSTPIQYIKHPESIQQILWFIESNCKFLFYWFIAYFTNHIYKAATEYQYFDLIDKVEKSNPIVAKIAGNAWGIGTRKISVFESIIRLANPFIYNYQAVAFLDVLGFQNKLLNL